MSTASCPQPNPVHQSTLPALYHIHCSGLVQRFPRCRVRESLQRSGAAPSGSEVRSRLLQRPDSPRTIGSAGDFLARVIDPSASEIASSRAAVLQVRIHFPPAGRLRTIGPSAAGTGARRSGPQDHRHTAGYEERLRFWNRASVSVCKTWPLRYGRRRRSAAVSAPAGRGPIAPKRGA
jgi:hypothetical protein